MSSWVMTVLIAFGKALLISLSILFGSCCIRFFYRAWMRRMGCADKSDDLSESGKYEMELQSEQEMNHTTSHPSPAHDALSEIELPPSPGANTSCPPYNTKSLSPFRRRCDDFSDNFSGMWRHHAASDAGETTSAELTSVAGDTTTVCSVLTGNDENFEVVESLPLPDVQPSPIPKLRSPPLRSPPLRSPPLPPERQSPAIPRWQSPPLPSPQSPPLTEFQDYQSYVPADVVPNQYPIPVPPPRVQQDRGTELFLSQYYKTLEQDRQDSSQSPPPV